MVGLIGQLSHLVEMLENSPTCAWTRSHNVRQRQNRLTASEVDDLVADYESGLSVRQTAYKHQVHRTTVMNWLKKRSVQTRRNERKMTDAQVAAAGHRYILGDSVASLARELRVDPTTLRKEFANANIKRMAS
jgi:hypothetical protein